MLDRLVLEGHNVFGDVEIPLSREIKENKNFKTILIGPNGAGKSNLLECIADSLTIEYALDKKKASKSLKYKYQLKLSKEGIIDTISNESPKVIISSSKLLAVTATSQDRFPFVNNNSIRKSDNYVYLGMKSTTNNIFFSSLKESILLSLFVIYGDQVKRESTTSVLRKLGFAENFKVLLGKGKNFKAFSDYLTLNKIVESKGRLDSKSFNEFINSGLAEKYKKRSTFIISKLKNKSSGYSVDVDLNNIERFNDKVDYLSFLSFLLDNNVISISNLSLFSSDGYDMNQASSGEFNILKIFLSIIANVENDSVLLIDEPEISLHPNWQMDFPDLLDLALSRYVGCHSIIATHSHFILSNVSSVDSLILSLTQSKSSRKIHIDELNVDSFGWSPENTLYRVFGLTGNRNKYLELDLRIIIDFMTEPNNEISVFIDAVTRIEKFNIESNDPLFSLLDRAKRKVIELEA